MPLNPSPFKKINKKKKAGIITVIVAGLFFGAFVGVFFSLLKDLPQIRSLENFNPSAVTRFYSSDQVLLAELFMEKRTPVPFDRIPDHLKTAIIATEDRKFYTHSGVDLKGIARAAFRDIRARKFVEGASTITQQLAKTLFLTSTKKLTRKLKEAILAFQLERRYTKDEILGLYLNQIYLGSGAYGVESAARVFFNKSVHELDLSQCALIAAMPKAPSRFSPIVNPKLAVKRRNIVLKQMLNTGVISNTAYESAVNAPLLSPSNEKGERKAPYFIDYIKNQLEEIIGPDLLYKGGLTVYTTLSYKMQSEAKAALLNGLDRLRVRMILNGLDAPSPQGALVAIDIRTGGILAMVGGRDYNKSPYNRATTAKRQPGSAFKPLIYALAISRGFPQNHVILDSPIVFKGKTRERDWKPENFSNRYSGEITLRKALTHSKNIPAVRLTETLGPSSVVQFAKKAGIASNLDPSLSLSLGASETTLIELTAAYTVLPNKGKLTKPYGIIEIVDPKGKVVKRTRPEKSVVISRQDAAIVVDMLQGVIQEGTGRKAGKINFPIGGKTGTTNDFKDALFIGFSPVVCTGVWIGADNHTSLGPGETGARAALPVWIEFMGKAHTQIPYAYFDIPDGIVKMPMNVNSGTSPKNPDNHTVTAFFKKGQTPHQE